MTLSNKRRSRRRSIDVGFARPEGKPGYKPPDTVANLFTKQTQDRSQTPAEREKPKKRKIPDKFQSLSLPRKFHQGASEEKKPQTLTFRS